MANKPDFKRLRQRLFPEGTDGLGSKSAPEWPPDLFAFAALCAEELGVYAEYMFTAGRDANGYAFDDSHLTQVTQLAELWNENLFTPQPIHEAWKRLMSARDHRVDWRSDVMLMLAVADQACSGVGFQPPSSSLGAYSHIVFQALAEKQQGIDPDCRICQVASAGRFHLRFCVFNPRPIRRVSDVHFARRAITSLCFHPPPLWQQAGSTPLPPTRRRST